ncbi:MAG: TRAP transporter small permease [Nitratireductor sp.]|uniref:TRAP transporter small permease n=1 Tax=Nitratireductor sp. TaxID=1872084 RepID=UPI00261D03D3|nr:TRAP transporter small permease [Nitratireductor sp.]MCV0352305.1 TRAP transporter small permease [Nitratireductor sp.]
MKTFERYFVALNKWALVLLLGAMAVIVFANVSLRYLTNFSITWSEEVARYLMIWMTFIGAGLALRTGGHVAISNFQEMLGKYGQRAVRILILLLLLAFFSLMIWMGLDYMERARFQLTPATRISFRYIYAAMPIGFSLLIVHLLLVARSFVMENRFVDIETDTPSAALAESGDTHIAANRD